MILSAPKGLGIKRGTAVAEGGGRTGAERAGGEEPAGNPWKAPEDAGCGPGRRKHPGLCGRRPSRTDHTGSVSMCPRLDTVWLFRDWRQAAGHYRTRASGGSNYSSSNQPVSLPAGLLHGALFPDLRLGEDMSLRGRMEQRGRSAREPSVLVSSPQFSYDPVSLSEIPGDSSVHLAGLWLRQ